MKSIQKNISKGKREEMCEECKKLQETIDELSNMIDSLVRELYNARKECRGLKHSPENTDNTIGKLVEEMIG